MRLRLEKAGGVSESLKDDDDEAATEGAAVMRKGVVGPFFKFHAVVVVVVLEVANPSTWSLFWRNIAVDVVGVFVVEDVAVKPHALNFGKEAAAVSSYGTAGWHLSIQVVKSVVEELKTAREERVDGIFGWISKLKACEEEKKRKRESVCQSNAP